MNGTAAQRLLTALFLGAVLVAPAVAPEPAFAQSRNPGQGQNGNPTGGNPTGGNPTGGNPTGGNPGAGGAVDPAATPELGSLILFGSGAAGFAAYAWRRRRAGPAGARGAEANEPPAP
jgi:hypothetical protein